MNTQIKERLSALRAAMKAQGLSAYYIPTADYHLSEYVGEHFKFRAWMSGFTGSAGTLVVLPDQAGLWTDGRYFLQAEAQLAGTGIDLYKMQLPKVPTIEEFLSQHLNAGDLVGLDGRTVSAAAGRRLAETLAKRSIQLDPSIDLADQLWTDRPALPQEKVWRYDIAYAGETAREKLRKLREKMAELMADVHIICALDEIAWLFNLRGSDVDYNPVFLSYAVIEKESAHLFVDEDKLSPEICSCLEEIDVKLHPYDEIYTTAGTYGSRHKILISENKLNYRLCQILKDTGAKLIDRPDPVQSLKAVKNDVEIRQTRSAHLTDGLIMTRFMKWLKETVQTETLTEASAAAHLDAMRQDAPGSLGLSFETIAGYGPHGAIVHYAVSEESDIPLEPCGLFLVDSGGQYLEGTTDITRTFALGPVTDEEKRHFTLVLRCMLNLMYAVFPEGVFCHSLDVLARTPLWEHGLDFLHGTGHGVGHLLNVHEGPNNFFWKLREGAAPVVLAPGMVTTDEPGVYLDGKHGIRLENELLCQKKEETEFGTFLCFEPLTLAPIDLDAVDVSLLTDLDRQRLNAYHRKVFQMLSPELDADERDWLLKYTREI